MQCCPRGFRQHCKRKKNIPRTTLHRPKPCAMLSERLCNVVLILLGHLCTGKTLCNVVPEGPDNIAQEKIQVMLSEQHLVTAFTYICTYNRSFTPKKIESNPFFTM